MILRKSLPWKNGSIDTAPTWHTLLLLESPQSYNKEIVQTQGDVPESVKELLSKLKDNKVTEVLKGEKLSTLL